MTEPLEPPRQSPADPPSAEGAGAHLSSLRRGYRRLSESGPVRAGVAIFIVGFVCLDLTLVLALAVGARGSLWFPDAPWVLLAFGGFFVLVGLAWDAVLLGVGTIRSALWRRHGRSGPSRWHPWRTRGFYSLGAWPIVFVLVTIYFLIATSNLSLVSLTLLESQTEWRDALFWSLEEPLFDAISRGAVRVGFWETIYNSGWNAEMLVLFVVLVVTRCPLRAASFCVSFILLFYVGRAVGLLAPVQGPAFFVPEHFGYLDGSITEWMMQGVARTMRAGASGVKEGAVLLGGVAALPSLHVGMISLAAWWLARSLPRVAPLALVWILAVWASTVLLGWHYAVDGLAGMLTAAGCITFTGWLLPRLGVQPPAPAAATTGAPLSAAPSAAPRAAP